MASITPSNILIEAARLVDQGWTQGTSARNSSGSEVLVTSKEACEFCILGATARAAVNLRARTREDFPDVTDIDLEAHDSARGAIRSVLGTPQIASYNDAEGRTQSEVSTVLRAAAEIVDVAV